MAHPCHWRGSAWSIAFVMLSITAVSLQTAKADAVADFYRGHAINFHVGFGPGGGYDAYARTLAQFYGDHIPGKPSIVVRNTPGAGSLVLANSLYTTLPSDGTVIGTINRILPLNKLLGVGKSEWDPLKMSWIGSPATEISTCAAWHKARATTVEDLRETEILMGGIGKTGDATIYPKLFGDILGLKFRIVEGYRGSADVMLAMERGEVEGFCPWGWASMRSSRPEWLRDGKIKVFMQLGMKKSPEHPDVPFVLDLAKTPEERQALELMMSPFLFSRPILGPPGIPADRLQALREGLRKTVADPRFVAVAEKRGLEIDHVSGEEIEATLERIYATPAAVVERVKAAIR